MVQRTSQLSFRCPYLVPARDDAAHARLVGEGLLAGVLGGPELFTGLLDDTSGVNRDGVALGDRRALTLGHDLRDAGESWAQCYHMGAYRRSSLCVRSDPVTKRRREVVKTLFARVEFHC